MTTTSTKGEGGSESMSSKGATSNTKRVWEARGLAPTSVSMEDNRGGVGGRDRDMGEIERLIAFYRPLHHVCH